jgi:hypothetical protein
MRQEAASSGRCKKQRTHEIRRRSHPMRYLYLLLLGPIFLLLRRARVAARITAITPGVPPIAYIALQYSAGRRPATVIVDIIGAAGRLGSATVNGRRLLVETPLAGWHGEPLQVRVETVA